MRRLQQSSLGVMQTSEKQLTKVESCLSEKPARTWFASVSTSERRSTRVVSAAAFFGVLSCLILGSGCDSSKRPAEPSAQTHSVSPQRGGGSAQKSTADAAAPPPSAEKSGPLTREYVRPAAERVVAIGDLHGDLHATLQAFRLAGAIDEQGNWSGGELVVVQTGDQLDRGDDEREILDFLAKWSEQAQTAGGALLVLNGNHETMNVLGDFRYVTKKGLFAFDEEGPRAPAAARFPLDQRGRAGAFLPGGPRALQLAQRPLVVQVGSTAFVHAGLRPPHVAHGIDRLNAETQAWMRGETRHPPLLVQDPEGPVWTRVYGAPELDAAACAVLEKTLQSLQAERLVIGHSVQPGGLNGACGGKVYRIDVGLAEYYGSGPIQVLEIRGAEVRVLSAPRTKK